MTDGRKFFTVPPRRARIACMVFLSASAIAGAAMVHQYSFDDGDARDSVSSANGTPTGGAKISDGVLTLGGDGGHVELPAGFVSTLSNFTISAWVKVTANANWARVFDFSGGTGTGLFFCAQNGDTKTARFVITVTSNKSEQRINAKAPLPVGVWTHIAVTLTNGTGILYLDGSPVGTNTHITLTPASLGPTTHNYIGKSQYPKDPTFNGQIDELRIFDQALSPADIIRKTYSTGAPR